MSIQHLQGLQDEIDLVYGDDHCCRFRWLSSFSSLFPNETGSNEPAAAIAIACWVCLKTGYPPRVLPQDGYRTTHPPKMYIKGGGRAFFIHVHFPPLKQHLLYELFPIEYIRWPKRWGIVPCSIFVRRGFNTLILQGHRSLMLMWFSWGTLQNNMTLLRPLPLKSEFART